jgi:hypothetical protein
MLPSRPAESRNERTNKAVTSDKFRGPAFPDADGQGGNMRKELSDIRKALKNDVRTELQASKLAKVAAAAINPKATATGERLEEAFRLIPIADQLRGESTAARQSAIELLDQAEKEASHKKK